MDPLRLPREEDGRLKVNVLVRVDAKNDCGPELSHVDGEGPPCTADLGNTSRVCRDVVWVEVKREEENEDENVRRDVVGDGKGARRHAVRCSELLGDTTVSIQLDGAGSRGDRS